ncbi:hypothetical protein [Conyzicola sp.]|uniref:hypothetical protein n=1 Tax=Conyzicola sp. TaxID=1969404 RepID=UPI00398A1210
MADIAELVDRLGGMAQKQQLVALGARDLDLTLAVRGGRVIRARQGWYSTLAEDDPRVRAVRVGGRLTGISAVIAAGGWVLGRHPLHVSVHDNAARLRTPSNRFVQLAKRHVKGLALHWDDGGVARRGTATSVDLRDALVRVVLDEEFETAVAALDWAVHTGRIDRMDFERIFAHLPRNRRAIREWVDGRCESLPESLTRTRLRMLGHDVDIQVRLGDLERIDLVVDDCVGIETDGREFHESRFEEDRTKDLDITTAGLHPLRPSANMVFRKWDRIVLAVERAIAARAPACSCGNSGTGVAHPLKKPVFPARSAWRKSAIPEFPKPAGNKGRGGALALG